MLTLLFLACDGALEPFTCDDGSPPRAFYADLDGDGFGVDRVRPLCAAEDGYVEVTGDCDDSDASTFPGADEHCDGTDNDCDGERDEDPVDPPTWFFDGDGDGHGDATITTHFCDLAPQWAADGDDCDDGDDAVFPGAPEWCDDVDSDCDGETADAESIDATAWHPDSDGDGYGDSATSILACAPAGLEDGSDCDDADADIHPGAAETCDAADHDCDGDAYAGATDAPTWYVDTDLDGYGGLATATACTVPAGYTETPGDCDDFAAAIHPGAPEYCDTVDHDCDGDTYDDDSVDAATFYTDADHDGYGDAGAPALACRARPGLVRSSTDCDDTDAATNPAAPDACDGVDHDCDGTVDEGDSSGAPAWYDDLDSDGYGDPTTGATACSAPAGAVADACDCDDGDAAYNPGALDCETITCAGGEVWLDDSCGLREVSATLSGTATAPDLLVLSESTTVTLCDGTHHLGVQAQGDVVLTGENGAATTTIDGAGAAVADVSGSLWLSGLTVEGGAVSAGAVLSAGGELTVEDSVVSGNNATFAAADSAVCTLAILQAGTTLTIADSEIVDNVLSCTVIGVADETAELVGAALVAPSVVVSGGSLERNLLTLSGSGGSATVTGAAAVWASTASFSDSVVADNTVGVGFDCLSASCTRAAAGGAIRATDVDFSSTLVSGNEIALSGSDGTAAVTNSALGGAVLLDGGSLTCAGASYGFTDNVAAAGGAVYWLAPAATAVLISNACDWSGNTPDDIAGAAPYAPGLAASFTCDASGNCG